jgi:hypothetical protein
MSRWLAHPLAALIFATICLQEVIEVSTNLPYAFGDLGNTLTLLISTAVGWLLAWKRPRNPLGWLLLADAGLSMLQILAQLLGNALLPSAPGAAAWAYWASSEWTWVPSVGLLFTQIPLRFPDGRLPSPRWRWFSWFTIVSIVLASAGASTSEPTVAPGVANPTYVAWTATEYAVLAIVVFGGLLAPSFIGSVASLFFRYRRARSVERVQLRWLFWAGCIPVVCLIVAWSLPGKFGSIVGSVVLVSYSLIPIAIAVAVLRYGLYGIDRIISRTVSYAIVTIVIVGVYVGFVLGIGALLPQANSVGVAIATLAAAAVFLPLLRVVQRRLDRRFDRQRYDAEQVVEAFGARLRNAVDPEATVPDLVSAVERALQPTSLGVWVPRSKA